MEKILPSSDIYSHPDRLLEDHLIGVAMLSELFLSEKPPIIKEQLSGVSKIIALSHDIGKATGYFQKYLKVDEQEREKLKNTREIKHSLLSAICAYYLTKELKTDEMFPFFAFFTVRRHHGNLINVIDGVILDSDDIDILYRQIESLDNEGFTILANKLYKAGLPLLLSKQLIANWINDFNNESNRIKKNLRKIDGGVSNYIILNLLYSLLLDADKSDVVIKDISVFKRKESLSATLVDNYKMQSTFPDSPINYLREKAYYEIVQNSIHPNEKIYSINLPTGLGKTLISMSFALKLRERIGLNHRIIYALPFLSIIDQNSLVFESVLRINGIKPSSNILLKHHHLAEIFYERENDEFESEEAKILIEGWNAEIIATTFVQLFHSLISNRNKSIRKFHRIANSIIILDEIQSVPIKYWLLFKNILLQLCKMLNTYIILVTATKPLIFTKGEIKELAEKNFYFKTLDRISLKLWLDKDMRIIELSKCFNFIEGKTYLFIFNTITAARDFYNMIKDKGVLIAYLSTHITPKERIKRIKEIKKGKYKVVVSTQLVEAGVDIDFDIVVRDIAPLDSINQSVGRCNRNGRQKGEAYIVSLKDEKGRLYSSYIYDPVLIDITRKIIGNRKEIRENEFLHLIDDYYNETDKRKSQDTSRKILDAITKLKYDSEDNKTAIEDFKLIEEEYPKRDVFIELDEEAKKIWQQYLDLKTVDELFKRKRLFDSIKSDFYQYVISIPTNIKNMPPMFGELAYVKHAVLRDYYDNETGFIIKDTKSVVIW